MAIRKIARLGHPILRQPATPVPIENIATPEIQSLINDLYETVLDAEGAGLAAPQIFESKQIVILDLDDGEGFQTWINPVITPLSDELDIGFEGCLSVPNMRGAVARHAAIKVDGFLKTGEAFSMELEGHSAVVAQHECDHLHGIVYTDRVEPFTLSFYEEYKKFGTLLWKYLEESLDGDNDEEMVDEEYYSDEYYDESTDNEVE